MKKQRKIFMIFIIALVVIVDIWGIASYMTRKQKEKKNQQEKESSRLCPVDADEITQITYLHDNVEVVLTKNADTWSVEEYPDITVDTKKVEQMLADFTDMQADATVESSGNLEDYGLKTPANTISAKTKAGESYRFSLSTTANPYSGSYYIMDMESQQIYTMKEDLTNDFRYAPDHLAVEKADAN